MTTAGCLQHVQLPISVRIWAFYKGCQLSNSRKEYPSSGISFKKSWKVVLFHDIAKATSMYISKRSSESLDISSYGMYCNFCNFCSNRAFSANIFDSNTLFGIVSSLDPLAVEQQVFRLNKPLKGEYIISGPDYIWSVNGHEKLSKFGIQIYAVIDVYS